MSYTAIFNQQPGDYATFVGAANPMQYQWTVLYGLSDPVPELYKMQITIGGTDSITVDVRAGQIGTFFGIPYKTFYIDISKYVRDYIKTASVTVMGVNPDALRSVDCYLSMWVTDPLTGFVVPEVAGELNATQVYAIRGGVSAYRDQSFVNDYINTPLTVKPRKAYSFVNAHESKEAISWFRYDDSVNAIGIITVSRTGSVGGYVVGVDSTGVGPTYVTYNPLNGNGVILAGTPAINDQTAYYEFYLGFWNGSSFAPIPIAYRREVLSCAPTFEVLFTNWAGAYDSYVGIGNHFVDNSAQGTTVNRDDFTPYLAELTDTPMREGRTREDVVARLQYRIVDDLDMHNADWLADLINAKSIIINQISGSYRNPNLIRATIADNSITVMRSMKLDYPKLDITLIPAQDVPTY